jgi:hypothetical protein
MLLFCRARRAPINRPNGIGHIGMKGVPAHSSGENLPE